MSHNTTMTVIVAQIIIIAALILAMLGINAHLSVCNEKIDKVKTLMQFQIPSIKVPSQN